MQRQRTPPTSACQPPSFEKRGRFAELFQKAPRQGPIPEVPPRSLADPPPRQWSLEVVEVVCLSVQGRTRVHVGDLEPLGKSMLFSLLPLRGGRSGYSFFKEMFLPKSVTV